MSELYRVELELTLCVVAENAEDASEIAEAHIRDELPQVVSAYRIKQRADIPTEWLGCYPYGAPGARKVEEFLNE